MSRAEQFMEQLSGLRLVALDTNACVYFLNDQEPWLTPVRRVLEEALQGRLVIGVPGVVLMELMVNAFKNNDEIERHRIESLVDGTSFIRLLPVTRQVLLASAEIRGRLGARFADAMVMGSACVEGMEAIVGNDRRFKMLERTDGFKVTSAPGRTLPRYLHLDDFVEIGT